MYLWKLSYNFHQTASRHVPLASTAGGDLGCRCLLKITRQFLGAYVSLRGVVMTDINTARPMIMYIDLNSCFASIEQQARPMLRNKPVAVVNRISENPAIVTASYEAKARGIKTGMRMREARRLCPELVMVESDPPKYRFVYGQLMRIMSNYSPHVVMKSIDEGVIDFSLSPASIQERDLEEIGREIKQRLHDEIGLAIRCSIGISTNRFLAKTASGLHKPDGLDVINYQNLRRVMEKLELQDLNGIASRNEHRLNAVGIYTPIQMLDASRESLRLAFRSVMGEWWYERLRGHEVDDITYEMKTCGR